MKPLSETTKDDYEIVKADLIFSWMCTDPDCCHTNRISYNAWKSHSGLDECCNCEKAHKVKEPWS